MKKLISFLFLILLALALSASVFATGALEEDYADGLDKISDPLPNSLRRFLTRDELSSEGGVLNAFGELIQAIPGEIEERISLPLSLLGSGTAILILSALLGATKNVVSERTTYIAVNLCTSVAFSYCVSQSILSLTENASGAISATGTAVKSAVPVFAGIIAAGGNVTSAAIFGFSVSAVSGAAATLISEVIIPLTGVIIGIGLVVSLYDNGLCSFAEGIKKCVVWALGIATSLFITALSLQTAVSGSTDFLMLKTARFLATSTVPIIGSSVSEATATLTSSIKLIKSTLGSAAIVMILFTTLPQIIINMLCSLALSINVVSADVIGLTEPQKCIRTIKAAVDIITAALVFYMVALIICVAIMIGVGG